MSETKTTKTTKKVTTPKSKEDKVMNKKEVAKIEKKEVVSKKETNKEKAPKYISIEKITEMYSEVGIKCANPTAKGNYRIMGSKKGSSLNVKPTKGYFIYSTDDDYKAVESAGLKYDDLILEGKTNSRDSVRPYTVICKNLETLSALLAVYATQPANKVVAETAVAVQ